MDLDGRVAVVTGGSRGIGAGCAAALAAAGARVVVSGRDGQAIAHVVDSLRSEGGAAIGVAADATRLPALEALRTHAERAFGAVDVLLAFAGGGGEPVATAEEDEAHWRAAVDANLTATFLTVRTFLPGMLARRRGAIVTMASAAGRLPSGASAAYAAAKAGIAMFSRHVASEVAGTGVRVNCLAPSAVLTERLAQAPANVREQVAASLPLGRLGTPQDVADAALFLASDASSWITGVTLDVGGGKVML